MPISHKFFQKIEKKQNTFQIIYEASVFVIVKSDKDIIRTKQTKNRPPFLLQTNVFINPDAKTLNQILAFEF